MVSLSNGNGKLQSEGWTNLIACGKVYKRTKGLRLPE